MFFAREPVGSDGRLIDGWRRIVSIGQPRGYIAFVGQRSDRVRFVKERSFLAWVRRKCRE